MADTQKKQAAKLETIDPPAKTVEKKAENNTNSSSSSSTRGLVVVLGIAVLLVLALITLGFLVAGIMNNRNPSPEDTANIVDNSSVADNSTTEDTSDSTENTADGSSDQGNAENSDSQVADTNELQNNGEDATNDSNVTQPSSSNDSNATTEDTSTAETSNNETPQVLATSTSNAENYEFTAGAGDSMSWLVRRAMYAYMGDRDLSLDRGQRLYFEVTLTSQMGSTGLSVGQVINFDAATLQTVFNQAHGLSGNTLQDWNNLAIQSGYF